LRDWAVTGCIEPTLCGMHMGPTNFAMLNRDMQLELIERAEYEA